MVTKPYTRAGVPAARQRKRLNWQSTTQNGQNFQQQFTDLNRGLAVVTDVKWESKPYVSNLMGGKRRKEERLFAVPDSIIVRDTEKGEFENSLVARQQVRLNLTL
jgi:PRP1 splicing factor, N-terminal